MKDILFLIPARGGSKGLPGKNIKALCGKPLIHYSIDIAREFTTDDCICVSTDDKKIKKVAEQIKLNVPFLRPKKFATDKASSNDVVLHALNYYQKKGKSFKAVVLLQPTSPLRLKKHVKEAITVFKNGNADIVIGVKETKSNPYSVLVEQDKKGWLKPVITNSAITRRQDAPKVYEINGAVYVYNVKHLLAAEPFALPKKKSILMSTENSVDIDTISDWQWAEFLLSTKKVKLDY